MDTYIVCDDAGKQLCEVRCASDSRSAAQAWANRLRKAVFLNGPGCSNEVFEPGEVFYLDDGSIICSSQSLQVWGPCDAIMGELDPEEALALAATILRMFGTSNTST